MALQWTSEWACLFMNELLCYLQTSFLNPYHLENISWRLTGDLTDSWRLWNYLVGVFLLTGISSLFSCLLQARHCGILPLYPYPLSLLLKVAYPHHRLPWVEVWLAPWQKSEQDIGVQRKSAEKEKRIQTGAIILYYKAQTYGFFVFFSFMFGSVVT